MAAVLFVLFVVVPIVEIWVFVQVASWIGALPALALVLVVSFAGMWLVKREGLSVARRVQTQMQRGELPTEDLVNGLLILVAGVLMVVPGFVTAFVGLLLLIPPTRAVARALVMRRLEARIATTLTSPAGTMVRSGFGARPTRLFTGGASSGGGVVDVHEVTDDPAEPGPTRPIDPPELGRY
jgi:UPF0716 protein FxsA